MALGGHSTRSVTPSSSFLVGATGSSSSPAANPSSTSQDSSPMMPTSSSLPFSFLITFIAIFLFFLGCGLGSRRVTRTLRRNFGLERDNRSRGRAALAARERPLIWDVCPVESKEAGHAWTHLKPLCASYVRANPAGASASDFSSLVAVPQTTRIERRAEPEHTPSVLHWVPGGMGVMGFALSRGGLRNVSRPAPAPSPLSPTPRPAYPVRTRPSTRPPQLHGAHVPGWVVHLLSGPPFAQQGTPDVGRGEGITEQEMPEKQPVQALQIFTVIAMPSPERAAIQSARTKAMEAGMSVIIDQEPGLRMSQCAENLGEYVLGVARVSWDFGEVDARGG